MTVRGDPRVINVVQARLASTRFARKALVPLLGVPMIEWVARRCERATMVSDTVFALPTEPSSDELADALLGSGRLVFRGGRSEDDVLGRVLEAAVETGADVIVRTCADRPLVDPGVIDETIRTFLGGARNGIVHSHQPTKAEPWDYGFGVEVLSASVLGLLSRSARETRHREHVTLLAYEDDLVPKAIEVIRSSKRASTSMLQRRLKIGYNRAARIMDILEDQGIVGPENGSSPREILIDPDA